MGETRLRPQSSTVEKSSRIIVKSIGRANAAVIRAVKQIVPGLDKDIASLLYQAPSELVKDVESNLAQKLASHLKEAGLDVSVDDGTEKIVPGDSDHEVALCIKDIKLMPLVIKEVAEFLGCDIIAARKIACSVPSVLIGNISKATAQALKNRFQDINVDVNISHATSAKYDIITWSDSPRLQNSICEIMGIEYAQNKSNEFVIALNKNHNEVNGMYEKLARVGAKIQVCNRDFQRYDIRLDKATDCESMRSYLENEAGIPQKVISQIFQRLPIIIHSDITHDAMEQALQKLNSIGAKTTGEPLAFQYYTLNVERVANRPEAVNVLTTIGDISETEAVTALANVAQIPKRYTKTAALWLRHELKKTGTIVGVQAL